MEAALQSPNLDNGVATARGRLARAIRRTAPPQRISGSEWADRYRWIPRGSASEHGKWDTDKAPYQREILDAACDPSIPDIVLMTASQVGKTEIINNAVGYHIDRDPCPILAVAPTVEMARAWSKDRVGPSIEDTPVLRERMTRAGGFRDTEQTILQMRFVGGHLTFVGANAPAGLAQRPIRIVVSDDIDRFPASAGTEGDPITLAKRRASTFWNRKFIEASTPTVADLSRIETSWEESDQRRFYVPCPLCSHMQVLKWMPDRASLGYEGGGGVVFQKDDRGEPIKATARYRCESCTGEIEEAEKWRMLRAGQWVPTYPERAKRGYHISQVYSPWVQWADLVEEWGGAHKHGEKLKAFVNTVLGEPWVEDGETLDSDLLVARMEPFAAPVPNGVGVLVASVDVQADRLEAVVKGYGAGEESWTIEHLSFLGDPGREEVWSDLDRVLSGRWKCESGRVARLSCVTIDSGGHHTDHVYRFCAAREARRIFAIKGMAGPREIVGKPSRTDRYRSKLFIVGVDTAKDKLWSRLKTPKPKDGAPSPGYIHLRDSLPIDYVVQLVSERPQKVWKKGVGWRREWVKVEDRNEGWDLEVYALAALYILGTGIVSRLGERAREWAVPLAEPGAEAEATAPRRLPKIKRGGWVGGWRK